MNKVGDIKNIYDPRKDGNPHLRRKIWVKCPECSKERWADEQWIRKHQKVKGLCGSCSAKLRPKKGDNSMVKVMCPACKEYRYIRRSNLKRQKNGVMCKKCEYRQRTLVPIDDRPRKMRSDGYVYTRLPIDHWCRPMGSKYGRDIMEHRLIMAEHLGRLLVKGEIVHHINGIRDDNRFENLELTTLSEHKLSYEAGFKEGFKQGSEFKLGELEKEIRLLRWQIKIIQERQIA